MPCERLDTLTSCCLQIDRKIVRTEIGVLLRLSHPHIVSLPCVPERALLEGVTGVVLLRFS